MDFREKTIFLGRCEAGSSFLAGLVQARRLFYVSSFLAGKEAKEAGGTYDGSPLTPFQRSTGTLSPSIAPAQGEEVDVSHQAEAEKYRASDVPPSRYWGGELCGADFSFLVKFLVLG